MGWAVQDLASPGAQSASLAWPGLRTSGNKQQMPIASLNLTWLQPPGLAWHFPTKLIKHQ